MSHIVKIEHVHYDNPIPVYDVINVEPCHNFGIQVNNNITFIHNCGML